MPGPLNGPLNGPLDGLKVLEVSEIIAAPYAAMLLADMGADGIKVEPPWGEPWRLFQQFVPLESRTFMAVNRGKRSLPLDLTTPEGQEIVRKLVPDMDVVVVNYRPDVPARLGVDYETLSSLNPRLIYCENTAFGSVGPMSRLPGYDIIVQATSGLMASEGKEAGGVPQHLFNPVVDVCTGVAMAWAICAALYHREKTGRGQRVEAALLSTGLALQVQRFLRVDAVDAEAQEELLRDVDAVQTSGASYRELQDCYRGFHTYAPDNIYYRTYKTRDGFLAVGCLSESLRGKLLAVLGLEGDASLRTELDDDARTRGEALVASAEARFLERTSAEWVACLDEAGVPSAPVRFTEEMLEDEQVAANGMAVELEHHLVGNVKMVGPLVQMDGTPLRPGSASPALGQHTDEILGALGYDETRVRELRDRGITR